MNLKAGYLVDSIFRIINEHKSKLDTNVQEDITKINQLNGLLSHVTSFDVEFNNDITPDFQNINPVLATINNIITRGLPTKAPVSIEKTFYDAGLIKDNEEEHEFYYSKTEKNIEFETIFNLLHIIEPGLKINKENYGGNPGSEAEWEFLNTTLSDYPFLKQILQSQRNFSTINQKMIERNVDYAFEFPYYLTEEENAKNRGVIFEFDGTQHNTTEHKFYDNYRDDAAEEASFETLRQKTTENNQINRKIEKFLSKEIINIFRKNFYRVPEKFLEEYSLIFIPLAVARIQKTLIEYFLRNPKFFDKEQICLAIIERDFPCAGLAIDNLTQIFTNINALLEDSSKLRLPEIKLSIFNNSDWVYSEKLHAGYDIKSETDFNENSYDIIIDHSILRRSGIYKEQYLQSKKSIKIRSSHYPDNRMGFARRVYCANMLHYKTLVNKLDSGNFEPIKETEESINFFIQNIFRKAGYREGQLPIISRALQKKPVIGLLPTGGGKSLAFQLSVLMQPGLCLIIDPIKSLMEDQVRMLNKEGIDNCDYINSNIKRKEKAKRLIDYRYGETQFLFVSPERFVMEDFRKIISELDNGLFDLSHSYCVIDEVHCVSEWGHDFRTTYLMLGKNAQKFTKTKNDKPVSLVGLTATASFDVLSDVERELQIRANDVANALIMIENTIRPELFFRVIDVTNSNDRINELNNEFQNLGENIAKLNTKEILEKSQRHHFKEFEAKDFAKLDENNNYTFEYNDSIRIEEEDLRDKGPDDFFTIIFCPVKGEAQDNNGNFINEKGVRFVHQNLMTEDESKGFFHGTDEYTPDTTQILIQENFAKFISDKLNHMVCTKAFGMGIDKKDIRFTFHYLYPSSLESLVQETGRAGRDQKVAEANILVSKEKYIEIDIFQFFRDHKENQLIKNNKSTRRAIRNNFYQTWDDGIPHKIVLQNLEEAKEQIKNTDFSLISRAGNRYNLLNENDIEALHELFLNKDSHGKFNYIKEKFSDRDIHNFFFDLTFKGIDIEYSQFLNLFDIREFQIIGGVKNFIEDQDTLRNEFINCENKYFEFILSSKKKYPNAAQTICNILDIQCDATPGYGNQTNQEHIVKSLKYSSDLTDFLFLLEEKGIKDYSRITAHQKKRLSFVYNRDRDESATGKLIYRMHSMGLIEDYTIDYSQAHLHKCTFIKRNSINEYVNEIERYLNRYLSEQNALSKKEELENRLNGKKENIVDDILVCLTFLSEFAWDQIADKRKRATDEIESIMIESISDERYANWFEQNKYIREQIYFYFNAKYARPDFKIEGDPYSLLDDYFDKQKNEEEVLKKYLEAVSLGETEQNNFKHMIGSCKKIQRSLAREEYAQDWILRLLKAFSMYAVNNPSYRNEANDDLKFGLENIYSDVDTKINDIELAERTINMYFDKLGRIIDLSNTSFKDINLIHLNLLLKIQNIRAGKIITNNQQIKNKAHA